MAVLTAGGCAVVAAGAAFGPATGLAALLAVAAGIAVLLRPVAGTLAAVALVPVVSGAQRGLPVPGLRLSELLAVGVAAAVLLTADARRTPPWRWFDWAALAYAAGTAALGLAAMAVRGEVPGTDALGTLLGPVQFLLLYRAVLTALTAARERRRALALLLAASVPVSLLALAQSFGVPGVGDLLGRIAGGNATGGLAYFSDRATGPFPHWQVLAGYLFAVVVVGTALLVEDARDVLPRWALAGAVGLALAATLASGTFTTLLAALAAALLLGAWRRRLGRVAVGLGIAAAVAAVAFGPTIEARVSEQFDRAQGVDRAAYVPASLAYRYDLWDRTYLPLVQERLVLGYGPQLPPNLAFPYTESLYLTLVLRGGVPLLLLYAALMVALVALAVPRARSPDPVVRALGRATILVVALLVPMHLLEPYFTLTGTAHVIWILAALLAAAPVLRRPA